MRAGCRTHRSRDGGQDQSDRHDAGFQSAHSSGAGDARAGAGAGTSVGRWRCWRIRAVAADASSTATRRSRPSQPGTQARRRRTRAASGRPSASRGPRPGGFSVSGDSATAGEGAARPPPATPRGARARRGRARDSPAGEAPGRRGAPATPPARTRDAWCHRPTASSWRATSPAPVRCRRSPARAAGARSDRPARGGRVAGRDPTPAWRSNPSQRA